MPVYNAPLLKIDPKETRRYAGLMRAKDFDERLIEDACQDARLLAEPRGIWQLYDYDCEKQIVKADPPFHIEGTKIGKHLSGCDKVILLAVTVGDAIEDMVTKRFADGEYASSVLLDAAATTAVEQLADGMEKAIKPKMAAQGYGTLALQPRLRRLAARPTARAHPRDKVRDHRHLAVRVKDARAAQERHGHHRPI